jgi:hypothetical protein
LFFYRDVEELDKEKEQEETAQPAERATEPTTVSVLDLFIFVMNCICE